MRIPDVESSTKVAALDVHFKMQDMSISGLDCPLDQLVFVSPRNACSLRKQSRGLPRGAKHVCLSNRADHAP